MGCNAPDIPVEIKEVLKESGNNSVELQKVISYFSKKEEDSLKLKAAIFLITQSQYHDFIAVDNELNDAFRIINKKIEKSNKILEKGLVENKSTIRKQIIQKVFDSIAEYEEIISVDNYRRRRDIHELSSTFLIDHINISFESYLNFNPDISTNFKEFLHWVLPYRAGREPLEPGKRRELYHKYKWVIEVSKKKSLYEAIDSLYKVIDIKAVPGKHPVYKIPYSSSQLEMTKQSTCNDVSPFFVNVLRAIGIPSGIDYLNKWGDEHNHGLHSWIFYKTEDGFQPLNAGLFMDVKDRYVHSSIPKVFRRLFALNEIEDVTHLYRETADVEIQPLLNKQKISKKNVFLGVFDSKKQIFGLQKTDYKEDRDENNFCFKNMGTNITYFPVTLSNDSLLPIHYPFKLHPKGRIDILKPTEERFKQVFITRKYAPFRMRSKKLKKRRILGLNGLKLQGSDTQNDSDYVDLYTLNEFNSTHKQKYNLKSPGSYKYYRLIGPKNKNIDLAYFRLLDHEGQPIIEKDTILLQGKDDKAIKSLFDDDPLTFILKRDFELLFKFSRKQKVYGFEIQARNDDNHINIGEEYELFYWDRNWKSLGRKIAQDTMLKYRDIPKNALYLLKNHTKGKEEFPFIFNDNGKQFWIGVSEYE